MTNFISSRRIFCQIHPDILPFINDKRFLKSLNVAEFQSKSRLSHVISASEPQEYTRSLKSSSLPSYRFYYRRGWFNSENSPRLLEHFFDRIDSLTASQCLNDWLEFNCTVLMREPVRHIEASLWQSVDCRPPTVSSTNGGFQGNLREGSSFTGVFNVSTRMQDIHIFSDASEGTSIMGQVNISENPRFRNGLLLLSYDWLLGREFCRIASDLLW